MKKHNGYMTRALKARDPRFAAVLGRLGYSARTRADDEDFRAEIAQKSDDKPAPKKPATKRRRKKATG